MCQMHVAVLQKTNRRVTANFTVLGFTVVETTYTSVNTTRYLGSCTANIGLHVMAMSEVSFTPVSYSKCSDFDSRFVSRQSQDGTQFHPDSAWKQSSKTCMKLTNAECTVENS